MTEKRAVMAFGRMNPPTTGHEKLMHAVHKEAERQGASAHIIASHSHDSEKNPIHPDKKIGYLKKIAPKGTNVSLSSKEHPSLLHHASRLHAAGHQHLTVVAAGDREKQFHTLLHKYNGKKGPHGHYNFKSITIHSAGKRDPDAEGTEGISGTKMRAHAKAGDHKSFKAGLPKALHKHTKEIMQHVTEERLENGLFEQYITEKKAEGGFAYERQVNHTLQKHGLQKKGQGSAGASADAPDGTIHANGKHHNLEIKQNKSAMMGQIGLHHDGKSWQVKSASKKKYPDTAKHIEKHFLPHINKTIGKPSGDYHKDREEHGNIYHTVKGTHAIRDHYGKDRKTPYMQIGKSGLHHTDKDHGNIGTKHLNGDTQYRMRVKYHGKNKKTGKVSYSHTVVFNLKNHEKSHIDIDHHAKDIAKKHAMNESTILEKTLTAAEKRKREEVAQAIKRDNPNMPMDKKMAIATSVAKKTAEEVEVDEALTYKQRVARKMIMRRHRPKMIMRKRMLARKKAPEKNIAQRARKAAIRAIRKRVAGKKGQQYHKLTPQEKIMVDQRVAKKQAIVDRIAKRMLPVMRKAELVRLKNRQTKVNEVFEEYIDLMEIPAPVSGDIARKHNPTLANKTKHEYTKKSSKSNIKKNKAVPTVEETVFKFVDSIMCNDYVLSEKEVKKLTEKAVEFNVPYSILKEVYDQGIQEVDSKHTPQQSAWIKLNAFLARPDLVEKVLEWGTPEATAFWKKATPGEDGEGFRPEKQVDEASADRLKDYMTKASDARGHRGLPTKKVDNRYAGVKLAHDKLAKAGNLGTTAKKVSKAKVGASENEQFENYQSMGSGATTNPGPTQKKLILGKKLKENAPADQNTDAQAAAEKKEPKGKKLNGIKLHLNAPMTQVKEGVVGGTMGGAVGGAVGAAVGHPIAGAQAGYAAGSFAGDHAGKIAATGAAAYVANKIHKKVQEKRRQKALDQIIKNHQDAHKASDVQEAGMPSSVIKSKQRNAEMSHQDFAAQHKDKSDDQLRSMAWRHGYGKGSNYYVNKRNKGLEVKEYNDEYFKSLKQSEADGQSDSKEHHATVEYEKGPMGPGRQTKTVKIPLKKVDTDKGFSRTHEYTTKEVKSHDIHKKHTADGWKMGKISYSKRPKRYSINGKISTKYEQKDPS